MSVDTEKLLNNAMNVFNSKLSDRQVIKLEGMEDYLKVPQYKALVNLEKKASLLELDATKRIMDSKIAYLKAVKAMRECEQRWLEEIEHGMESLEERNRIVKEVNMMMRKGDYSLLNPPRPVVAAPDSSRKAPERETKPPIYRRPEVPAAKATTSKEPKSDLTDIKKRLAMMDISMDSTPARPPLHTIHSNKAVEISETPKSGPTLSSKGSLNGSIVPSRAAKSPLLPSKWDVPAPNFDETIDAEPSTTPRIGGATSSAHRPLPSALLSPEDREDTFPLNQPSLPFQTPTVPHSRPFLLSSMRKKKVEEAKGEESAIPTPRPAPTPLSSARVTEEDPLATMGLMKLKRPVLNSEIGKMLMGQL